MTSSCLAFELSIGRVTFAGVVIEWWHLNAMEFRPGHEEFCFCQAAGRGSGVIECWHLNVLEYRPGHEEICFCQAAGRGSGVTSSCLAFEFRG